MGNQVYTITEYESFLCGREAAGFRTLPKSTFALLREFVLTDQPTQLMTLSGSRAWGEMLTAQNYVGVISLPDGAVIEILPKIFSSVPDGEAHGRAKQLLLQMLRALNEPECKRLPDGRVDTEKMDLLEIFIQMFLKELRGLVQRGLKRGYETTEENLNLFKGKMLFSQQICHNFAHQERCYVAYDQFTVNRPENRLIKSTLLLLQRKTGSVNSQRDIRQLLAELEGVEVSRNVEQDFARCSRDRSMTDYRETMDWCRVFLRGRSLTSFAGQERTVAFLYPMEKLFESYVAAELKKTLDSKKFEVTAQGPVKYLFEEQKQFKLIPDLVVKRLADKAVFIMDTKWKRLSGTGDHLSISRADLYQMYVYQKKYGARNVTLIYPQPDLENSGRPQEFHSDQDNFHIFIRFVDLFRMGESMEALRELLG